MVKYALISLMQHHPLQQLQLFPSNILFPRFKGSRKNPFHQWNNDTLLQIHRYLCLSYIILIHLKVPLVSSLTHTLHMNIYIFFFFSPNLFSLSVNTTSVPYAFLFQLFPSQILVFWAILFLSINLTVNIFKDGSGKWHMN